MFVIFPPIVESAPLVSDPGCFGGNKAWGMKVSRIDDGVVLVKEIGERGTEVVEVEIEVF